MLYDGKATEAEKVFEEASAVDGLPEEAGDLIGYHLGVCRMLQNQPAADLMQAYATSKRAGPDVHMLYARALIQQDRTKEAKPVLWKVWENGDSVLRMKARQLLRAQPDLTQAEKKRLTRPSPGEAEGVNNDHVLHARRVVDGRLVP